MTPATRARRRLLLLLLAGLVLLVVAPASAQDGPTVAVTQVRGPITPVIADHLADAVETAVTDRHEALVVQLDTPGGLVTSMRTIVQTFLEADVPVVVHVSPRGADAGSAGTFITIAAHVAAMSPATTIGAATPVDLEGGEISDKVVNNAAEFAEAIAVERGRDVEFAVAAVRDGISITADEALDNGTIDLIAADLEALLADLDGRTVELANGTVVTLATAGARTVAVDMSWVREALQRIADPNLAFLFLSIGTLALLYEFANPGVGLGGTIGAIMLVLAMFSLSVLPVSMAGIALIVLAIALFIGELFVPGIGVMAAGATVSLIVGGLLLFQRPTGIGVDLWVLLPTAGVVAGVGVLIARFAAQTVDQPTTGVTEQYVGRHIEVERADGDRARARLDGTWWRLLDEDGNPLSSGDAVEVVAVDGTSLVVRPVDDPEPSPR